MGNLQKDGDALAKEGEVMPQDSTDDELQNITSAIESITTPIAKAHEISETEASKRTVIFAGVAIKIIYALFGFATLAILLAGYALYNGNEDFAEKIIIALFAFLGGLGAGKASSN